MYTIDIKPCGIDCSQLVPGIQLIVITMYTKQCLSLPLQCKKKELKESCLSEFGQDIILACDNGPKYKYEYEVVLKCDKFETRVSVYIFESSIIKTNKIVKNKLNVSSLKGTCYGLG